MRLSSMFGLVGLTVVLAGCQTLSPAEIRARNEKTCASYGFKRGTASFSQCLLDLDLDRNADRREMMRRNDDFFRYDPFFYQPRVIVVHPRRYY